MQPQRPASSRTEYLAPFGRTVAVAEFDRPNASDDHETAQTIQYMDDLAAADAGDPRVRAAAREAIAGLPDDAGAQEQACAVYWWLKRRIRYVPTPGTSPLVDQTLIAPATLLDMPDPEGDCPQFSMLAAAIFRVLCIPCYFVTVAAEANFPDQYSHVYNTVETSPGVFMPFDSSNGPAPGAEYSAAFKRRIWPRIQPDQCAARKATQPMMRTTRPNKAGTTRGWRNRALKGTLGDTDDTDVSDSGSGLDIYAAAGVDPGYTGTQTSTTLPYSTASINPGLNVMTGSNPTAGELQAAGYPLTTTVQTTSPSGQTSATTLAAALAADATQLVAPIVKAATTQQPYYITNPTTGQSVLYNPNTGTVGTSAVSSLASISPVVLFGLLGVGLLALMGRK